MSKRVQVNVYPESSVCWDMGDVCAISTAGAACGSHVFQHNFQLFTTQRCAICQELLVSLEFPNRHSLLIAVILCNTYWLALKSLVSPQPKIQRIKDRQSSRPVDWASMSYPWLTRILIQVLSDNVGKMRWYLSMHEPHVWRSCTCSKSTGNSFARKRW